MPEEVLLALNPISGGRYTDGTVGLGGHAAAILRRSAPDGWLYGCDHDQEAVRASVERLAEFAGRFEIRRGSFAELADWVPAGDCDGVLLDLGMSSWQLDRPERGFSFMQDGPLDMRMDDRQARTAADLVNNELPDELINIFRRYGDEPNARKIAGAIENFRTATPFETTKQLADLISQTCPRYGRKKHPATRVFQALRIAVNNEMAVLADGLESAMTILKPGGRLAVISFHSLEDRMVKVFGRRWERDYEVPGDVDIPELRRPVPPRLRRVNRKAICPTADEITANPRSRSAQLRVFEKI